MDSRNDKIWFPAKTYGFGWGFPVCWQGWVVFGAYLLLIFGGAFFLLTEDLAVFYILYVVALSAALIFACWLKGEPPRWSWGKRNRDRPKKD
jgi:hypothetical protein